jgi:hypothetical protein
MKFRPARLGLAQSLVALSVSLAVALSSHTFAFASLAKSAAKSSATTTVASQKQTDSPQSELRIISATATATAEGVLLQWRTNSAADNVGFNVYRLRDGQRTRVNKEIIPGAVFAPGALGQLRAGYSYSWFDRGGTADATYYIESVSLQGTAKTHEPLNPVTSKTASGFEQTPDALSGTNTTESTDSFEKYYPAAETEINSPQGTLEDQWAIAAQTALKIAIKKDGWYRVTQPQMVAAGFNPTVDIRNLRLFVDAQEVSINTSQHSGPFGSGDYIEFYGRGLDTPTTDARIYYLIGGTTPGKRVRGEIQLDEDPILPPAPTSTPPPPPQDSPTSTPGPVLQDPIFFSWAQRDLLVLIESLRPSSAPVMSPTVQEQTAGADGRTREDSVAARNTAPEANVPVADTGADRAASPNNPVATASASGADRTTSANNPVATAPGADKNTRSLPLPVLIKQPVANAPGSVMTKAPRKFRKSAVSKKRKRNKVRREFKQERNHAVVSVASAPPNFAYTAERKDRGVYFVTVLNGDAENWFGQVITFNATNPTSQTINTPNPELTAAGTAQLEIALQGVNQVLHQISVEFNGVVVGSFSFFGFDPLTGGHPVQVFNIPVSQLQNGANTIRFIVAASGDTSIVDYTKLTYPHLFRADAGALKFTLRGTQSVTADGFATPSVRLIDYTDPLNVSITKPASEPSGSGFAITVPTSDPPSKPARLLYAIADGQFDQPAGLSLNQPSTLNQGILSQTITNGADFLVVSHKNFIPSLAPLLSQRQSQQAMTAAAVDVEDIYDEFSYGVHGPQAIRDFLSYASTSTHWVTKPRYVIFTGDASYDPRNYLDLGNFDLVPTKLVDATFNETASDDWLTDFDNDQIANIPVGRLPVRTVAEANLVVSKLVNFTPLVPQNALLVADDPTGYFFNFEIANDQVQLLLPASMTVQRVNVRTDGPAQAKVNVIAGFNQGRALVNYSGHGNVNVWASSSIFTSNDALALTNGNNLSFVVVMDCLNGYFQDPTLLSISEALLKAPNGGAVAAFASSGLTFPDGQHEMSEQLYTLIYGAQPIALGDAIKIAKGATTDLDVRSTWIFFGDPSMKIR